HNSRSDCLFLVKVRASFCASLRLYRPEFSDERNLALYGVCSRLGGHGHDFEVEVAVTGRLDPHTGMVVDFRLLDRLVREQIVEPLDHSNLNEAAILHGVVPTSENLAARFWDILEPRLDGARLHSISLSDRAGNMIVYYGPSGAPTADFKGE